MDEKEFKKTLRSVNPHPCVFEKTILSRNGACEHALKHNIAEREAVGCDAEAAQSDCTAWLSVLRDKAVFALGGVDRSGMLAHAKALRLQVGGLRGLHALLVPEQAGQTPLENIHGLIDRAKLVYGNLHTLPYQEIVKGVASFKGRRRASERRRD